MIAAPTYFIEIQRQLSSAWSSQTHLLQQAAEWIAQALLRGRYLYVFGTGHSHMIAEEVFYRAGGLAQASAILEEPLMLHLSASASTQKERESGYAARILQRYDVSDGDVVLVVSNSGRNAVPIEMVLKSRECGAKTIALTSLAHSRSVTSRHPSGQRLFEVADLVIDNGSVAGDAAVEVPGTALRMGPTSSVVGIFLVNALVLEAAALAVSQGWSPAIYASANGEGAIHNESLLERFRDRIRHL